MNEEEVKVKIVLPFLERIGIGVQDIELETSFTIKAGRHVLKVGGGEPYIPQYVGARLDILVKRNNKNLLLVETKAAEKTITDEDRDQAISYARLVHPVAPYALVTNGISYKLYDSISKKEVSEISSICFHGDYTISLPESEKLETLQLFLCLSKNNLLSFCREQVKQNTKHLIGSATDRTKKFIPDLHVPRKTFEKNFLAFSKSDQVAFALLGQSGIGKTSSLCEIALDVCKRNYPALFYQGHTIERGLLEEIADEFDWVFSEQENPISLVKRIEKILSGETLFIFVDSIDEWLYPQRVQNLCKTLKNIQNRSIKLVLSCNTTNWESFLLYRGLPTGISDYIYKIDSKSDTFDSENSEEFFYLQPFNDDEYKHAIYNYNRFFDFQGLIENNIQQHAKENPFFLRILYETAHLQASKNKMFSILNIYETYYRRLIEKTSDPRLADRTLISIAELQFTNNRSFIDRNDLRKGLRLGLREDLMEDLFKQNILIEVKQSHSSSIGFYFQGLRDQPFEHGDK